MILSICGSITYSSLSDLANFMLPGKVKGIGGAMDLVANPSQTRVVVTMEHVDKKGNPKILPGKFRSVASLLKPFLTVYRMLFPSYRTSLRLENHY